jgi:hypothetical protein
MKVFRKIRQELIEKGRVKNYILYAIGEIILVVIGILIALQINIWNEERKKRDIEHKYYHLLLDEVEQDHIQLKTLSEKLDQRIQAANEGILLIQNEDPDVTKLSIAYLQSLRYSSRTFEPNEATFQDIKSSGNLGVIRDKNIISLLNSYYKEVRGYTSAIIKNFETDYNNLIDLDSWIEAGVMNGLEHFHPDMFTEEIRKNLKEDMPKEIQEKYRHILYDNLVTLGVNNYRRKQLLDYIKIEVELIREALRKKCPDPLH